MGGRKRGKVVKELVFDNGTVAVRDGAVETITAWPNLFPCTVGEEQSRCRVFGYSNLPMELLQALFPVADDEPLRRLVGRIDIETVGDIEGGLQEEMTVSHTVLRLVDAGKILETPGHEVAQEHDVVAGVHLRVGLVAVPQFPDRRRSLLCHIPPRRIGLLRGKEPGKGGVAVLRERAQEPARADDTCRDVPFAFDEDIRDEVLDNLLTQTVGDDIKMQGKDIRRGGVVAIEHTVGIEGMTRTWRGAALADEEPAVEGFGQVADILLPHRTVGLVATDLRHLVEHPADSDAVSGGDEFAVSEARRVLRADHGELLGRYAPVTVTVTGDDTILQKPIENMEHKLFDRRIMLTDRNTVTELPEEHVAPHREGGGPTHVVVGEIVPECRCDVTDRSVGTLSLVDVLHPLGIEAVVVEEEALTETACRAVAEPRLPLVTLWAVDGHAFIVALDSPPRVLQHAVERRVGSLDMSDRLHRIADSISCEISLRRIL